MIGQRGATILYLVAVAVVVLGTLVARPSGAFLVRRRVPVRRFSETLIGRRDRRNYRPSSEHADRFGPERRRSTVVMRRHRAPSSMYVEPDLPNGLDKSWLPERVDELKVARHGLTHVFERRSEIPGNERGKEEEEDDDDWEKEEITRERAEEEDVIDEAEGEELAKSGEREGNRMEDGQRRNRFEEKDADEENNRHYSDEMNEEGRKTEDNYENEEEQEGGGRHIEDETENERVESWAKFFLEKENKKDEDETENWKKNGMMRKGRIREKKRREMKKKVIDNCELKKLEKQRKQINVMESMERGKWRSEEDMSAEETEREEKEEIELENEGGKAREEEKQTKYQRREAEEEEENGEESKLGNKEGKGREKEEATQEERASDDLVDSGSPMYHLRLDDAGRFTLDWRVDLTTEAIRFTLTAPRSLKEDVLFGFSDYGSSTNADVVRLRRGRNGRNVFEDMHSTPETILRRDFRQDYILTSASVSLARRRVRLTFVRKFDTCDVDDYVIDSGTTHVLFGTRPPGANLSANPLELQRVQLVKSQLPDPPLPADVRAFTVNVRKVQVPVQETTYWCKVLKLPEMKRKHHVIKYEGAISAAGTGLVHHLEVFHCEDVLPERSLRSYDGPCRTGNAERPRGLEGCRKVIGAWAMGAKGLTYPEEAGYPIGGPGFAPYVMLEVHYNNPKLRQGVVDDSGLRFFVTERLRKYDAGVMELGMEYTDKYALPPRQPRWLLRGYCVPECTAKGLPLEGINIFASQLHTHLTGKRAHTKHFRNGVELPEVNRDDHYSPHYQEIRKLHRVVRVLPGDSLLTTCEDSTVDRNDVTLGGFAISDEMCVNYVHYFPATPLEVCKSSPQTQHLRRFFRFLQIFQLEKTSDAAGISENYRAIRWRPLNAILLKRFYERAPLSMQCNQSDGSRFQGKWENIKIPEILQPLPDPVRPCLT